MLNKKSMLVLLLFLILTVAVSSASASEIDSADFISAENSDGFILEESEISSTINDNGNMLSAESGEGDLISAEDSDNDNLTAAKSSGDVNLMGNSKGDGIIGASSSQSFSDLNALINGNDDYDIYLNSNYTYNSATDSDYLYGIKITRPVYIHGNGYTIYGNSNAKGFNVSAANVIFDNINFRSLGKDNGQSIYDGSAIYSSANNTYVYNSNFTSCYGNFGGALSGVNAENCNFNNCIAGRGIGAAMYGKSAKNCTFTNNQAYQGGAINTVNADNCTFINNYAYQGGAVMNGKVTNCVFIRNSASYGGAVYASYSGRYCINCTFINNYASSSGGAYYGGSINDLVNCTFENNTAPVNGTARWGNYILCTFINTTDYNTSYIKKLTIGVPVTITVDYPSQVSIPVNLTYKDSSSYYVFENVPIFINLTKNGVDVANFTCLSGQNWVVDLEAGTYKVNYKIGDPYTAYGSNITELKINGLSTNITASDMNITYGGDNYLIATLKDANGNVLPNQVIVASSEYNRTKINLTTDSNGQVNVSLKDMVPRNYDYWVWLNYLGNGSYENSQIYAHIRVNKIQTQLDAYDLVVYYGNNTTFSAKLKDEYGNAISNQIVYVYLNGQNSYCTTNDDGEISFMIPALNADTYQVSMSFDESSIYYGASKTVNLTVKKYETHIDASDLRIINTHTGELTATVLDEFNNTVSDMEVNIEFNGETIVKTTNSMGQVQLDIPQLAEGNYSAAISFAGNEKYSQSSKDVNVEVSKIATNIDASDVRVIYGDEGAQLIVTFLDENGDPLVGYNLTIEFNGQNVTRETNGSGEVSIDIPILDEGTYPVSITYDGTEIYSSASNAVNITVTKIYTSIVANDISILYGETPSLSITLLNESGDVMVGYDLSISLNGASVTKTTDSEGKVILEIPLLPASTYPIDISFAGLNLYNASSKTVNLIINQIDTKISSEDIKVVYSQGKIIAFLTNESGDAIADQDLYLSISNISRSSKTDGSGQAVFDISELDEGSYSATISFMGTELYKQSTKTINVNVSRFVTTIVASDISILYGETPDLTITLLNESGAALAEYDLTIVLNGTSVTKTTDSEGKVIFEIPVLSANTYPIAIEFKGFDLLKASNKTINLEVKQIDTKIVSLDATFNYGEGEIVATLTNISGDAIANCDLLLSINNNNQSLKTDGSGQVRFNVQGLADEDATATIIFKGTELYKESSTSINIHNQKEDSGISADNVTYVYKENSSLKAILTDSNGQAIAGETLHFTFNGISEDVITDSDGCAVFKLDGSNSVGEHSGTVVFDGNSRYKGFSIPVKITVSKIPTQVHSDGLVTTYGSSDSLEVTLKDYNGNPVKNAKITVKCNSYTFTAYTNSEGVAYVSLKTLPAISYNANIIYDGDSEYVGSSSTTTVVINKASSGGESGSSGSESGSSSGGSSSGASVKYSTKIETGSFITVYNSGKNIVATLRNSNNGNSISGAKVSIVLNGKTHTLTTDANGQVKLTTKGLAPKSYQVKVSFAGNGKYYASSFTMKVIVKKAKPKFVSVKKKTYAVKTKTKKYVVTLKTNKNKVMKKSKLTLKVFGKTYTAKTNKKGKATFKITKLNKKGKFTAVIKFKGTKYYSAIKKSVKLTVK